MCAAESELDEGDESGVAGGGAASSYGGEAGAYVHVVDSDWVIDAAAVAANTSTFTAGHMNHATGACLRRERVELVGSRGRWKRPCLQTTRDATR
jgi:hypothetical protein